MEYPGIFFFPFSEPTPIQIGGMGSGLLARRIPDFLCICLNEDGQEHAGLLEMRAADENGIPTGDWAEWTELPAPGDIMSFLPVEGVRAAIVGTLRSTRTLDDERASLLERDRKSSLEGGLEIDLTLIRDQDGLESTSCPWQLNLRNPGESCFTLARKIAQEFALPVSRLSWDRLGTENPSAFMHFLHGLEGVAWLDPEVLGERDPCQLLMPFVEALEQDPDFGIALRRLHIALRDATSSLMMSETDALDLLDRAYAAYPSDKVAATAIGEFLVALDEGSRAEDWLRLAITQPDPPAAALETLGILLANRGEMFEARSLWLTGLRVDGHPDFLGHLARLDFSEDNPEGAWDKVLRGLRRISEQRLHPGEWDEDEGRGGVMLRYLSEHLEENLVTPPTDVKDLLLDLCDQIREPEDRLDLGICLALSGQDAAAKSALRASVPHVEDPNRRDIGAQYLTELLFPGFEAELESAAKLTQDGDELAASQRFLETISHEVPQFWPAFYFAGKLHALRGDHASAFDAFRKAAAARRDQASIFAKLATAASRIGKTEEAIAALRTAVELEPAEAGWHANLSLLLFQTGAMDQAHEALEIAETLAPEHDVVREVAKRIRGDAGDDETD